MVMQRTGDRRMTRRVFILERIRLIPRGYSRVFDSPSLRGHGDLVVRARHVSVARMSNEMVRLLAIIWSRRRERMAQG